MLGHYIDNGFIIDIKSTTFRGALSELLECCPIHKSQKRSKIVDELLTQEGTVSSYLGHGIALPHIKVNMRKSYLFALGRIRSPLNDASVHASENIRLIILLLASSKLGSYFTILSSFAKMVQSMHIDEELLQLPLEDFKRQIVQACRNIPIKRTRNDSTFNRLMLRETVKIAKAGN